MGKKKLSMMNLEKNITMTSKGEMVKELDPSPAARTKPEIATDLAAEAEIRVVVPNRETKKTGGTETGAGIAAEAETVDMIVKGKLRGESHPEAEPIEKEVQIEVRRETLAGAGALGARVTKKPVKTDLLTGIIKTENLETTKDDITAAAAALTATERKKRAVRVLIANPKEKEAQKSKSQIVLEAEIIIKNIVLLVPVLTVTDMARPIKKNFIRL